MCTQKRRKPVLNEIEQAPILCKMQIESVVYSKFLLVTVRSLRTGII